MTVAHMSVGGIVNIELILWWQISGRHGRCKSSSAPAVPRAEVLHQQVVQRAVELLTSVTSSMALVCSQPASLQTELQQAW